MRTVRRSGHLGGGVSVQGGVSKHTMGQTPSPLGRMTDACENITFPQLLLRAVITVCRTFVYHVWLNNNR